MLHHHIVQTADVLQQADDSQSSNEAKKANGMQTLEQLVSEGLQALEQLTQEGADPGAAGEEKVLDVSPKMAASAAEEAPGAQHHSQQVSEPAAAYAADTPVNHVHETSVQTEAKAEHLVQAQQQPEQAPQVASITAGAERQQTEPAEESQLLEVMQAQQAQRAAHQLQQPAPVQEGASQQARQSLQAQQPQALTEAAQIVEGQQAQQVQPAKHGRKIRQPKWKVKQAKRQLEQTQQDAAEASLKAKQAQQAEEQARQQQHIQHAELALTAQVCAAPRKYVAVVSTDMFLAATLISQGTSVCPLSDTLPHLLYAFGMPHNVAVQQHAMDSVLRMTVMSLLACTGSVMGNVDVKCWPCWHLPV